MSSPTTPAATPGAAMEAELTSQPQMWAAAAELAATNPGLPMAGQRVAVVGCGTSWFMAQSYASLRESLGLGETDAFAASEMPLERGYDAVVAITRSGTTTEVLDLVARLAGRVPTIGIVGDVRSPFVDAVDTCIELPFADEVSVVQTRFATTALALLRASLGQDLTAAIAQAQEVLATPLSDTLVDADQYTFLGEGWSIGLAYEAALKLREAAQAWTEAYPALEYRHGPIAIAAPGRVTWSFGELPAGLADQAAATGAHVEVESIDPLAALVRVHAVALERSRRRGLDPDAPRALSRSVILDAQP